MRYIALLYDYTNQNKYVCTKYLYIIHLTIVQTYDTICCKGGDFCGNKRRIETIKKIKRF